MTQRAEIYKHKSYIAIGELYFWTTTESDKVCEVYFDDFKITHEKLVPDLAHNTGSNWRKFSAA